MDFKDVEVLIGSTVKTLSKQLYEALKSIGVGRVVEVGSADEVEFQIRQQVFDLLILTSEIKDVFVGELVKKMRHGRLGESPFPVVIILAGSADPLLIKRIGECGPDTVLLTEVAAQQIAARVKALALDRKPFQVTHAYIGPDRRKEKRPDSVSVPVMDVPNPLASKTKRGGLLALPRETKAAKELLNRKKIEGHAIQLRWLIDGILKATKATPVDVQTINNHSTMLVGRCQDLLFCTEKWLVSPIADLTGALIKAAESIAAEAETVDQSALIQLVRSGHNVTKEIQRVFPG